MIKFERVSKRYAGADRDVVRELDLDVDEGSLCVLLGESGSGKTTTLKMVNRLIEPSAGRILIAGSDTRDVAPVELRRRIGYAFQGIGLFPHMNVAANIAIVPRMLGWTTAAIDVRVDELLRAIGLNPSEYRHRLPSELSGGQQQRVGVARALAARARVLLMDEPFGALDPITRDELQRELKNWQQALGLTILLVTHDVTEALLLADRIAVLKDGVLRGAGAPNELATASTDPYIQKLFEMPRRQAERVARIGTHV